MNPNGPIGGIRPFVAAAVLLVAWLGCGGEPRLCEVCQRPIHSEVQATLDLKGGGRVHACCPRCVLHEAQRRGAEVARIEVTDHGGGGILALADAWLVEGSDVTPCLEHHVVADATGVPLRICYDRCMPSLIAFGGADAARGFVAAHGGTLLPPGTHPSASHAGP